MKSWHQKQGGDFQEAVRTMCLGTRGEVMMHEVREETVARERVCPCRPQKQLHVTVGEGQSRVVA